MMSHIVPKEVYYESSDDESCSDIPNKVKFQYKIVKFMKNYYIKNPRAKSGLYYRRQLKINWAKSKLSNYITQMIRSYRDVREIMDKRKLSFEDLDDEYRKQCPFYKELHEALQLSDYYRALTWRPGRPKKMMPVKRINSAMSSEDKVDVNMARTRISNRTQKNSNTNSTEDKDQLNYGKSTDDNLDAVNTIEKYSDSMIMSYRQLRCKFDKLNSCANRIKLISERCPYFFEMHEAYQLSDFYRNFKWKPTPERGPQPQKTSELQPTISNASSEVPFLNSEISLKLMISVGEVLVE